MKAKGDVIVDNGTLAIVISIASLFLSVLGPLITALINGRFRIKEKELEIEERIIFQNIEYYEKHRTEVVENFLKSASQYILNKDETNSKEFGASIPEIYLYVDEAYWKEIDNLIKCINAGKHSEAMYVLTDFTKSISKIQPQRQKIEFNSGSMRKLKNKRKKQIRK